MTSVVRPAALTLGTPRRREFSARYVAEALRAIVRKLGPLPRMLADMDHHDVEPDSRSSVCYCCGGS
jgi:hypothetical protein